MKKTEPTESARPSQSPRASQPTQLTLGIRLDDEARFDNFYISAANRASLESLSANSAAEPYTYLFGADGCGRTHLLQALCHAASQTGQTALYLPLAAREQFGPEILQGAHQLHLVTIDDLPLLAADARWENALFTAFNLMKESGTRLVVTAPFAPRQLPVQLPDLKSRLNSGLVFQIQGLDDDDKRAMLQLRAEQRGMKLPDEVANYILRHAQRDMHALIQTLDQLDAGSLTHKRKLTIPLVKATLAEGAN
ncbi:MAG: DnaA regulatory inactivator Hda [Pseudohongiellaceae bacterium]